MPERWAEKLPASEVQTGWRPACLISLIGFRRHERVGANCLSTRRGTMLRWALVFLVVALIAGALGFTTLEGVSADTAKVIFLGFVIMFVVALITGRRAPS